LKCTYSGGFGYGLASDSALLGVGMFYGGVELPSFKGWVIKGEGLKNFHRPSHPLTHPLAPCIS